MLVVATMLGAAIAVASQMIPQDELTEIPKTHPLNNSGTRQAVIGIVRMFFQ